MRTAPLTLADANAFVAQFHRHHKPVQGHRFSIAAISDTDILGVAIVGRPVARGCARICKEMGFRSIQTYILASEPGISLRAAGWTHVAVTAGGDWNHSKANAGTRRTDQPQEPKHRWEKVLQK